MNPHRSRSASLACLLNPGLLALVAAAWLIVPFATAAEPSRSFLHLANGGYVEGVWQDSAEPGIVRWQPSSFAAPFHFPVNAVNAIHFRQPAELPKAVGDYCFELAGGDVVFGALVALDDKEAVLDIPRYGRLHVERSRLLRMERASGNTDLVYLGPNGLTGWHAPTPKNGWREEAGQLVSNLAGATIAGNLGLPARAVIDLEISWKEKPDFALMLGVGDDASSFQHAFQFTVDDDELIVRRETDEAADVASVGSVRLSDRVRLRVFLDQAKGRLLVCTPSGKPLADLKVADAKPSVYPGISLINIRGDVRLERLRISRWTSEPPREAQADATGIQRAPTEVDRDTAEITVSTPMTKEFVVREESGETRVAEDRVAGVVLSLPHGRTLQASSAVLLRTARGSAVRLDQRRSEKGEVWLSVPGVNGSARLAVSGLRSLVVLRHESTPITFLEETGTLDAEGVHLRGRLADGRAREGAGCLAWVPFGSLSAGALRPGIAAKIVYREPKPAPPHTQPQQFVVLNNGQAVIRTRQVQRQAPLALHLRSGDNIPSVVTKIDEKGVWYKSPFSAGQYVPNDKVKAVELAHDQAPALRLNKPKRERLLTLPRMQKESPPTHLVRSVTGDYLRGRVLGMDDKVLRIELHLETKEVPRDRVARIIWLHPEELDPKNAPAPSVAGGDRTRVQAVCDDGIRLSFVADRLAPGLLSGQSDVIGPCQVPLKSIDQLLIGGEIEKAAAALAYQQWTLHNAPEPKSAQDDGGSEGVGSALVGKPAPEFALDLLDGKTFRLSASKGKVVVLDFWATWCGPCMQAMPQVERVTGEFAEKDLQLIAVNLQETPKQITDVLERHKLRLTVALDRDGIVAEKYAAHAIPQTVIIDRDGNVARLFVGGGPHFDDQLRDALRALLPDGKIKARPQRKTPERKTRKRRIEFINSILLFSSSSLCPLCPLWLVFFCFIPTRAARWSRRGGRRWRGRGGRPG